MVGRIRALSSRTWVDWLAIAIIGLGVQAFWAARLDGPTYMDAYYYATNGQRLASGEGFTEMVIWQFLDDPAGLPAHSHTFWMPLTSLIAAAGYLVSSDFFGAQLPFLILGGLLPLLSYGISLRLSGERWQAWAAALFSASGGFYAVFLSQPSTFAPFAWSGASCLLALGSLPRAPGQPSISWRPGITATSRSGTLPWLIAGVTAGLAQLTRADGILLLLLALGIWTTGFAKNIGMAGDISNVRKGAGAALGLLILGYLLVMGGWFGRNWLALGRPLPTAGSQSIFLTTYDDLFAYDRSFGPGSYFAWGWAEILRSKASGLWNALQTYVVVPGFVFLTPFVLAGWLICRRHAESRRMVRPVSWYAVLLFLVMSLLFTFPSIRGSLFHSSIALWPWSTALAAVGIGAAVDWASRRLSHWKPARAKKTFSALFVAVAFAVGFAVSWPRAIPSVEPSTYLELGARLPQTAVVMIGNAPALNYYTGLAAVSVPNEPVEVLLRVADRYQVTHLFLDTDTPRPLEELYAGNEQHARLELVDMVDDRKLFQVLESDGR